ncbi:hypothetical protein V8G54_011436 [Vigna mungo]|uniref:Uncharacterized protein n=1 Tax=Vigna mungo TaxID=3915 RepID=A0AAQ3NRC1_VIGMU
MSHQNHSLASPLAVSPSFYPQITSPRNFKILLITPSVARTFLYMVLSSPLSPLRWHPWCVKQRHHMISGLLAHLCQGISQPPQVVKAASPHGVQRYPIQHHLHAFTEAEYKASASSSV